MACHKMPPLRQRVLLGHWHHFGSATGQRSPLRRIRAHPLLPLLFETTDDQVGSHSHCMKLPESTVPKTSDEACSCDIYYRNCGVNHRHCGVLHRNCGIDHCKQPNITSACSACTKNRCDTKLINTKTMRPMLSPTTSSLHKHQHNHS